MSEQTASRLAKNRRDLAHNALVDAPQFQYGKRMVKRALAVGLGVLVWLSACSDSEPEPELATAATVDVSVPSPTILPLPADALVGENARPSLCEREGHDLVRETFCGDTAPSISSLADLQHALKLRLQPEVEEVTLPIQPGMFVEPPSYAGAVVLSHSTALSGDLVSPINPRAIIMTYNTFLAFNRGVQQVELAVRDRETQEFNLYLLSFRQACNAQSTAGCSHGDLYAPSIESDWTQIALQDDEDLKNTPSDCRQCHQRGVEQPMLLMRELDGPWTHFFSPESDPHSPFPEPLGEDLLRDYLEAKGDEPYAGLSTELMGRTLGFMLQNLVNADQPLLFDGAAISNERWPYRPAGYLPEAQRSPTWDANYAAFKRGEQLALPYYAPRATDPQKQAQLTEAYKRFRDGELPAAELPDLADIFPEDALSRAEIGMQTEPGATPAELLIQACGACHNDVLDQSISRARFNIALGRLPALELKAAIARLELDRAAPGAMPPPGRRQLDAAGRARLIAYLKERMRGSSADDALLTRAAQLGMAQRQPTKPASGPATLR